MITTEELSRQQELYGRDSALAARVLRTICRTVSASLPKDVRRVLKGIKAHYAELPPGIEGVSRTDGAEVILDRATLEQHANNEAHLENLLVHELAHAYRAIVGRHDPDEVREERATERVVKSWGFRDANARQSASTRRSTRP